MSDPLPAAPGGGAPDPGQLVGDAEWLTQLAATLPGAEIRNRALAIVDHLYLTAAVPPAGGGEPGEREAEARDDLLMAITPTNFSEAEMLARVDAYRDAVAAHHRAEGERWKRTAEVEAVFAREERARAERAEAALREAHQGIGLLLFAKGGTLVIQRSAIEAWNPAGWVFERTEDFESGAFTFQLRALSGARPGETT